MMIEPPSPVHEHDATLRLPAEAASQVPRSLPQVVPRSNPPPPNPPFVFPPRPLSSSSTTFPRTTARRPRSAIEPRDAFPRVEVDNGKPASRPPPLPAFSFNPGASLPDPPSADKMFLSPPESPSAQSSPRLIPTRPHGLGHRRGGSEFVGGSIRDGEAITVLTNGSSPTKSESGTASPMLQPTRPRRGHAHRRSAAISSHDLSSIIVPPSNRNVQGGSSPSSPVVPKGQSGLSMSPEAKPVEAAPTVSVPETEASSSIQKEEFALAPEPETQPAKPATRNRVGFSDTLEYIPRPVSIVSTDTSSTVTARPGHSVSGSISSIMEVNHTSGPNYPSVTESRPSTAGAILERSQTSQEQDVPPPARRRGSIPLLGSIPPAFPSGPATPSPTRASKKWSLFGRDSATGSPTRSKIESPRISDLNLDAEERKSLERAPNGEADEPNESQASSKAADKKKKTKKPKKVKNWAGSILSRKGKHHGKPKRRAPTPPPLRPAEFEDIADMFPEPEAPSPTCPPSQATEGVSWETWTFPKPSTTSDDDSSYPMIDLDAALGPFNTPLPRNPEWEAAQRAAGGRYRKALHSAAGMSRFSGPGMHYYHRRAESAPELAPWEDRFGFPRFGSSSTMADVFEEDEEEEEEDSKANSVKQPTTAPETTTKSELLTPTQEDTAAEQVHHDGMPSSSTASLPTDAPAKSREPSFEQPRILSSEDVIMVEPGHFYSATPSTPSLAHDKSASATPSPRHVFRPKDLGPVEVSPLDLPTPSLGPVSPWSTSQSPFPSPRSPMSYDAQCISTAPSSITDGDFQSLLLGEPGPEVRISVDDIPSLTSSQSTMTRDSLFPQHPQARHPPLKDQPRPASFTATAFGRRRSSLASLSRLVSSSHGERSKLSLEVTLDSEPEENNKKKSKISKAKRLSRMMQFWRSKESHHHKEG
ncbi:uncharacterized protein CTHT_0057930 [Thermochaetoides thermophila DSM 1495]|uniref:Cell wall proline rich protein n=1 Tax=Chaetomium thermophilum (strain DSM 1495 / CBS 144.50 / IMI 039719) TaxID=759272 RepID=G0SCP2_CHATD|nr:hypothetical protein CTHT_0057930 [Thermochaetoides thermophila DSM 1495]EGS19168.1 hypothetical protein CTHT_0057930 [Thermochaetoides thermophila DSM 1495]